jgi:antagonist of KipI
VTAALRVESPGLLTTIQDLGRPNAMSSGVSRGGAMDRFAHSAANLLVGNDAGAATIECTLLGPRLIAERACLVAITGGDLDPSINGRPAPQWAGFFVSEGDHLTFGAKRAGARAYIAIAGGVMGDRWLGSASTNLMAARGGMHGRALTAGDMVHASDPPAGPVVSGLHLDEGLRPAYRNQTLHVIAGPHVKRLDAAGRSLLFDSAFEVGLDANRMGYRLKGPELSPAGGEELLSFGLTAGALQLPSGGRPILLMADCQTAGGYPVIATVVSAALPIAAQLAPGDEFRFAETDMQNALRMRRELRATLSTLRG